MKQIDININEIMSIIPHRYPLLLVDRVTHIDIGKSIIGIKNITANEPQFTGHFPGNPIMPGVLIVEAMAQLAAVLVAKSMDNSKNKEIFFMSIGDCKFRKPAKPGDRLTMHVNIIQNRSSVWKFKSYSEVDEEVVAQNVFTAMVRDKKNG